MSTSLVQRYFSRYRLSCPNFIPNSLLFFLPVRSYFLTLSLLLSISLALSVSPSSPFLFRSSHFLFYLSFSQTLSLSRTHTLFPSLLSASDVLFSCSTLFLWLNINLSVSMYFLMVIPCHLLRHSLYLHPSPCFRPPPYSFPP